MTAKGHQVLGWVLVTAQVVMLGVLVVLVFWPVGPSFASVPVRAAGAVLVVVGGVTALAAMRSLGRALTAHPVPRHGAPLQTGGPYRVVRHPIYAAVLALGWGLALVSATVAAVCVAVALTLLLWAKARFEEGLLRERHEGYAEYAAVTPRFVPGARRRHGRRPTR